MLVEMSKVITLGEGYVNALAEVAIDWVCIDSVEDAVVSGLPSMVIGLIEGNADT